MEEKKVNTVGIRITDAVKVATTKTESKKVTNMVGTFLPQDNNDGFQIIKVTTKEVYISSNPTLIIFSLTSQKSFSTNNT